MRKLIFPLLIGFVMLAAALGWIQVAHGQGPGDAVRPDAVGRESQGDNTREVSAPAGANAPQQPSISFIDSPTVTCYRPDPGQDSCYLNWYYMSVDASPNYMITMTVSLNAIGVVAHMQGFFQNSMYAPYSMFDRGIRVSCGALGAGGNPGLGNAYAWTIRARDSAGLTSANYGTAYCPAAP